MNNEHKLGFCRNTLAVSEPPTDWVAVSIPSRNKCIFMWMSGTRLHALFANCFLAILNAIMKTRIHLLTNGSLRN